MKIGPVVKTLISNNTFAANANIDITSAYLGIRWAQPPAFLLTVVENSGSSNMQCFIQGSFDGGATYHNMITFTDQTGNNNDVQYPGNNAVHQINPCGDKIRLAHAQNTTGNWTITLKVAGFAQGGA